MIIVKRLLSLKEKGEISAKMLRVLSKHPNLAAFSTRMAYPIWAS